MTDSPTELETDDPSDFAWDHAEEVLHDAAKQLSYTHSDLFQRINSIYEIGGEDLNSYQRRLMDFGLTTLSSIFHNLGRILENYDLDEISACNKHAHGLELVDTELGLFLAELSELQERRHNGN
jgi:hypothetical protein